MYCFDTDILSAVLGRKPPLHLIRRLASLPAERQLTTAITVGELLHGSAKRNSAQLTARVRAVILSAAEVLPFDEAAAQIYGSLRADLESQGRRLAEPDLRIASIVLSRDLTLVTGNDRQFARVPQLRVENWLKN